METNPIAPRQRHRRADRSAAAGQDAQPSVPVPQTPPLQQTAPVQPATPAQPQSGTYSQPVYAQSPRTMYQQPSAAQPVRPSASSYPQMGAAYPQNGYPQPPQPPVRQPEPMQIPDQSGTPVAAPRPRALNQPGRVNSGWQQPTVRNTAEAPHARSSQGLARETARSSKAIQRDMEAANREKAETGKPVKKKIPGWITTAMSLAFLLVLGLVTAYWLMQAYLTTQENARIAAYEAVLDNHHITKEADGTLRVTWQDYIETYAAQYNLQPAFVTAIIRNESSFRTNAESSVGARGLMQMMPDTAEWIAGKLDDDSYTFDSMWDAETNIRYGCWYLGYLSKLFRGDAVLVSAAYHAGQSTITQWLSDPTKSSDGVTLDLDNLSDGPTKQYIGRVTQTYGIYQTLLYPDAAFGAADSVSAGGAADASAQR